MKPDLNELETNILRVMAGKEQKGADRFDDWGAHILDCLEHLAGKGLVHLVDTMKGLEYKLTIAGDNYIKGL